MIDLDSNLIKKIIIGVIVLIVGIFGGYNIGKHFAPAPEPEIRTEIKTQTRDIVQYVEKDSPTDADVKITNHTPVVEVNGKKFVFDGIPNEQYKFDKGRLDIQHEYFIEIEQEDSTPKWGMSADYTNHGIVLGAEYNFNKHVSIHGEGTVKKADGKDNFYGVGLTVRF